MTPKLILPAVAAAGLTLSVGCGRDHASIGFLPGDLLASRLMLSNEQRTALRAAFKRHKPALSARMEALVQTRNAMLDAALDPALTPEAWRPYQERTAAAMQDLAREVRATYLEALPLLTETQKREGKALMAKFHGRMEGMHGRHHTFLLRFVKDRLELSDAQVTTLQAVHERHQPALEAKRKGLHQAMVPALETALDPNATQATMDQRFAAVKEAGIALGAEIRAAYLEAAPTLTPEQHASAKELVVDTRNALDSLRKLLLGI